MPARSSGPGRTADGHAVQLLVNVGADSVLCRSDGLPVAGSRVEVLLAPVLVGLGVTSLSMAPGSVAEVRAALAGLTLADCERLAELAVAARDGREARAAVAAAT